MADSYLDGVLKKLAEAPSEDGMQGLPTAQPVTAEPAIDYIDLSKINLSGLGALADPGPAYDPNSIYYFHTNNDIGIPNASGGFDYRGAHPIQFLPGMAFEMRDKSGKVIGTASSPEEMQNLVALSEKVPVYTMTQTAGQGLNPYASGMMPEKTDVGSLGSLLVNMGAIALPAIGGAALGPLLSGALGSSAAVGTGLGTAIGSAASGVTAGKSIGDILKQAAIAGITSGGLQALAGASSPNTGGTSGLQSDLVSMGLAPSTAANIAGKIASGTGGLGSLGEIVVPGIKNTVSGIGSVGGALASAAPNVGTVGPEPRRADYGDKVQDDQEIVVPGQRLDRAVDMIANGGTLGDLINAGYTLDEVDAARAKYQSQEEPAATVIGAKPTPTTPVPVPSFTPGPVDNVALPQDEIVVTRKQDKPVTGIDAIINSVAPSLNAPTMDVPATTTDKKMGIGDYIRLGLLANGLVAGAGGGDNTTLPTTGGGSLGNYTPLNRTLAARGIGGTAGSFDPFTYGQALPGAQTAEFEFFEPAKAAVSSAPSYNSAVANFDAYQNNLASQVAAGDLTPDEAQSLAQTYAANSGYQVAPVSTGSQRAPAMADQAVPAFKDGGEAEDDMVRHLTEWHKGGGHTGPGKVKGIGSGQEDLIPAWLSDGEYVWSAQDVADLGDGSTDEGVRRLDKMRQMVRRRAGRKDVKKIAKPQHGIDTMLKAVGGSV